MYTLTANEAAADRFVAGPLEYMSRGVVCPAGAHIPAALARGFSRVFKFPNLFSQVISYAPPPCYQMAPNWPLFVSI